MKKLIFLLLFILIFALNTLPAIAFGPLTPPTPTNKASVDTVTVTSLKTGINAGDSFSSSSTVASGEPYYVSDVGIQRKVDGAWKDVAVNDGWTYTAGTYRYSVTATIDPAAVDSTGRNYRFTADQEVIINGNDQLIDCISESTVKGYSAEFVIAVSSMTGGTFSAGSSSVKSTFENIPANACVIAAAFNSKNELLWSKMITTGFNSNSANTFDVSRSASTASVYRIFAINAANMEPYCNSADFTVN